VDDAGIGEERLDAEDHLAHEVILLLLDGVARWKVAGPTRTSIPVAACV
jgi:hypothetical protein